MIRMIKRLPPFKVAAAIIFLVIQIMGTLILPYLTAGIVDQGIAHGDTAYIWRQGMWMIGLTLLSMVGAVVNTWLSAKIAYRFGQELRNDIYQKVLSFSKKEYDRFGAASLITRNTNDVTRVQDLVEMGLKFLILAPLYLIGGIGMTMLLSRKLALVFIGMIPILTAAALIIHKYASRLYAQMQDLIDRLNLLFREGLSGVRVIRAFGREKDDYKKYRQVNQEYTRISVTAATIMSLLLPLITLVLSAATVFVVWVGAHEIQAGSMETGAIMGAVTYAAQITIGFVILTNAILAVPKGQISIRRIDEVLDTPLSITSPEQALKPMGEELRFCHVDFAYPGAAENTLSDINFCINPGQTVAIAGSTGDGKTSLVNLVSRLYDVCNGAVQIGGTDIRDMSFSDLRSRVSQAGQESTLFMGTIRDNLRFAKPNATEAEMVRALRTAQAWEFVSRLENGLDSQVEKNGGNFSGGQRQRLCIARTILKEADIYIFDDSFSALDMKTDMKVRQALRHKLKNAVTMIVAQRISTIKDADLIIVLEQGKIAGLGTHDELKASSRVYQEIVESQTYREVSA